jgi:DNA-binding response OmpR family regulator
MYKILLVDDEPLMLKLLELYLLPYGFACISMTSGHEAVGYLEEGYADLIIMDVMMPGKDGWETTREIREFSNIPIIIVTARDQAADIIKSINCGANGHISKPIEEHTLIKYVHSLIEIPI